MVPMLAKLSSIRRDSSGRHTRTNRRSPAMMHGMSRQRNSSRKCCQPKRVSTRKSASQDSRAESTITAVRQ